MPPGVYVNNPQGATTTTVTAFNSTSPFANQSGSPITVGPIGVNGICSVPAVNKVFAANNASGAHVAVINMTTNTVVTNIALPSGNAPFLGAASPDNNRVYFPNSNATHLVSVIDVNGTGTSAFHSNVTIGSNLPQSCVVSPDSLICYCVWDDDGGVGHSGVSFINTSTLTVPTTVALPNSQSGAGQQPEGCALTPDGGHLWIVGSSGPSGGPFISRVWIVDTSALTVVQLGPFNGPVFRDVAITPDGTKAWVTDGGGTLEWFDTSTHVRTTTAFGGVALGIGITPDGTTGFAAQFSLNQICVFNPSAATLITTLSGGTYAFNAPSWLTVAQSAVTEQIVMVV